MLSTYLQRIGVTTGPLSVNTSHSGLEVIKKWLIGAKQFKGDERYLISGNAVHEVFLVGKNLFLKKCNNKERKAVQGMVIVLGDHTVVRSLMANSLREQKFYVFIDGVQMAMILDIKQIHSKTGADLKTTACATLEEFTAKAVEYGYFRQGETYKQGAELKHFYFIGITKNPPHRVFILDVSKFPVEQAYAQQELKFLLYFFKHYGKIVETLTR